MAELIVIPLKTSSDVDIVKPLKNLIQSANPGECNEDFTEALNELARLRTNAIWKVSDKSSLEALYNYYDQIAALAAKVPPQEVQIPFKWRDAFDKGSLFGGKRSLTVSSLEYERLCILFNIAAVQSAAAAAEALDTEDSLKLAARMLQQAAGALEHVRAHVLLAVQSEPTPDLHPDTLAALAQLVLAQAQEVCVRKCVRDAMKDASVAKVAAHADDLYAEAQRALVRAGARVPAELAAACGERALGMRGLAQLHAGRAAGAAGAHGERVARLRAAADLLARTRLSAYSGEAARAARALADAVRENDFVYHEPEPRDLPPLARAPVVRPAALPAHWGAGAGVWAALPDPAQRAAAQEAHQRRAALVADEISALRAGTAALSAALAALGLPGAAERAAAGELPEAVARRAAAVAARGGADALAALADALPALLARNTELLAEAERLLREEADADRRLRDKFGDRWTRTESARLTEGLRANADKYRAVVEGAARADGVVRERLARHAPGMRRLQALAAGAGGLSAPGDDCDEARAVRDLMRQADELRAERARLEGALKEALAGPSAALEALRARARESLAAQEALLARVREAAARLPPARASELPELDAAHDACLELHDNLTEGTTFYSDLTHLLLAFQNKVADYCFARHTEKEELLAHLSRDAARADTQTAPRREAPPAPIDTPDAAPGPASAPGPGPGYAPGPATAPGPGYAPGTGPAPGPGYAHTLPYPTQPQGMPQPLGGAYFPTPLPPLYNPYATLPYPHHYPPHYPYPPPQ